MTLPLSTLVLLTLLGAPERGPMARTSTSVGTADPGAEDEEHRPVEVPEPGTNERLIADIRATTGEITLPAVTCVRIKS